MVRMGNKAFNEKNIEYASKAFKAANYKDGLIRVGDYYYYEDRQPLRAYGYYRQAGHEKMIDKIYEGFTFALKCWLSEDAPAPSRVPAINPGEPGRDYYLD